MLKNLKHVSNKLKVYTFNPKTFVFNETLIFTVVLYILATAGFALPVLLATNKAAFKSLNTRRMCRYFATFRLRINGNELSTNVTQIGFKPVLEFLWRQSG